MKQFIYCLEEDKNMLIKEGLKFICTQNLGDKTYYVFKNKEIKNAKFNINKFITSNKMFFN